MKDLAAEKSMEQDKKLVEMVSGEVELKLK